MSAVPIANNAHVPADPSPAGRFSVDLYSYDSWGNPRSGESGLVLQATPQAGTLFPAPLVDGITQNVLMPNKGERRRVRQPQLGSNVQLANVFYGVGQPVAFVLQGTAGTQTAFPALVNFDPTIHTVLTYHYSPSTWTPRAGDAVSVVVHALDYGGNSIIGVDPQLNAQTYVWSGAHASPVPSNLPMTSTPLAGAFSNGNATTTLTFYKAETLGAYSLNLTDNHSQPYLGARHGTNYDSAIVVNNGLADHYVLGPDTNQPVVGSAFGGVINVATNTSTRRPTGRQIT